ncbi:lanthionine synthetase LanC family protein [Sporosarcina sp. Marseille-Q4943]|uniref:lanthionine synthetase LanC family protein n=1 Tax=Sporosarcina sp. Marseille-Q4943 TaxID=2942204 RepID=UPI00208DA405|nr:lanthionine synthetase LanC family protein [Sporosarcina sp. Marseille-Q4943]
MVDISPDNVMVDGDLNVYFIDLEDCFIEAFQNKASYSIPNAYFSNSDLLDLDIFNQDKHKVGYLIMSVLCSANEMLSMDKTGAITLKIFNEFSRRYSIPNKMYQTILNLICNPSFSLLNRKEYTYPTDQTIYSVSEDYKILLKSLKTAKKDCLSPEEFCGLIYIEHDAATNINVEELSLVNQCLYLIKEVSHTNNLLILERIMSKERELKENLNRFMEEANYSLTDGALAVAYFYLKLYEVTLEKEFLSNTLHILLEINEEGKYISHGKLIPNSKFTCSPYMKYTSGYIRLGLMYLRHKDNDKLKTILKDYLKGIDNNFPKNPSYLNGLSGIADTFIDAYKFYGDASYLNSALDKYTVIRLFKLDNDTYPCNDLEKVSLGFNNGMLGILHFFNNLFSEVEVGI